MPQTLDLPALKEKARSLRLDILDMTTNAGSGHPSSSFSSVEILTALYFGGILRYRSDEPHWPERDRFLMSKGHAAPLLYTVLAHAGYFDREKLWTLRQVDSPVEGHPVQGRLPGIETTSGSLGKGISVGLGHVLGGLENGDGRGIDLDRRKVPGVVDHGLAPSKLHAPEVRGVPGLHEDRGDLDEGLQQVPLLLVAHEDHEVLL